MRRLVTTVDYVFFLLPGGLFLGQFDHDALEPLNFPLDRFDFEVEYLRIFLYSS